MLKNKQNAKRTMKLSAHYMLDNKCKGTSMYYVITKGEGEIGQKMVILDYLCLVLKVITKGRGLVRKPQIFIT